MYLTSSEGVPAGEAFKTEILVESTNTGGLDAIDTVLPNLADNISTTVDSSNNVHLTFIDDTDGTNDTVGYKKWTNATKTWGSVTQIDASESGSEDAYDAYVSISLDTDTNDLYVLWIDTNNSYIYYRQYDLSDPQWETQASWKTSGVNTNVTSNYSGATRIFAEWTVGDGSPYHIQFDTIIIPEYLWLFFLPAPFLPLLLRRKQKRKVYAN